jgi:hypothetical protein
MLYPKVVKDIERYQGKTFGELWYTHIISTSKDGYDLETGKVLFKFRKKVISNKLQDLASETWLDMSKKKHSNRGIAAGIGKDGNSRHYTKTGQNEGTYVASNISGYIDRPLREHRGPLGTIVAGRPTAFTLNNSDLWIKGLPFVQNCSGLFKEISPIEYNIQKKEWKKINEKLKIPRSVFTTVTSNYNWQTKMHRDSGNFDSGLGNLVITGKDFTGGYLGFPEYRVLIKIEPGDFLLMDSNQWHCNTPIKLNKDGYRLSFVMYIRSDMSKCQKLKKIGKDIYYI